MVLIPRAERGLPFLPRAPSSAQSSPANPSMPWARSGSQALTPVPLSQLVQGQPFSPTQAAGRLGGIQGEGAVLHKGLRVPKELQTHRPCPNPPSSSPPQPSSAPLPPSRCPQVSPRPNLPRGQSAGCSQPEVHGKVSDNTAEAARITHAPQPATTSRTSDFYNHPVCR